MRPVRRWLALWPKNRKIRSPCSTSRQSRSNKAISLVRAALLKRIAGPPELRARAEESLAVIENRETGKVNLMRLRLAARLGPVNWMIEKRYIKALADLNFPDRAIAELETCLGGRALSRRELADDERACCNGPAGLTKRRSPSRKRKPTMFICTIAR